MKTLTDDYLNNDLVPQALKLGIMDFKNKRDVNDLLRLWEKGFQLDSKMDSTSNNVRKYTIPKNNK